MKKTLKNLFVFFLWFFSIYPVVHAATPSPLMINGIPIPITFGAGGSQAEFGNLGDIVSKLLFYIFPLSGLILFGMIIWSGFQLMTSAGDPKGMEQAKQRLTWSVVGFVVIFVAFWLMRILEFLLGITIL